MKKLIVVIIFIAVLLGGIFLWWNNGLLAANPNDKTSTIFVIEKGQGIREIANSLKQRGLIKDPVIFFLLIKQRGLDNKIQAGSFRLLPSMKAEEIAENLTHGTLDIWVTIPEGKRADEIADILKKKVPTYDTSWRQVLNQNEGYLFPDTYLIPKDADVNLVISIMKNNFNQKYASLNVSDTNTLSQKEIVTIASMIEREGRFAEDLPIVASVILNRYNIGMKLDIDATVQYALGYQAHEKTWWKKGLTYDDLALTSPYNTYKTLGLPPTPISNPGLGALQAVVNPAETDYLFYISDKTGHNHYAKTIAEHEANIKKYEL